jgi:hypothetical protein
VANKRRQDNLLGVCLVRRERASLLAHASEHERSVPKFSRHRAFKLRRGLSKMTSKHQHTAAGTDSFEILKFRTVEFHCMLTLLQARLNICNSLFAGSRYFRYFRRSPVHDKYVPD